MVLLVVVGGFGWFWMVLGGFGWFWVVPCFSNYLLISGTEMCSVKKPVTLEFHPTKT